MLKKGVKRKAQGRPKTRSAAKAELTFEIDTAPTAPIENESEDEESEEVTVKQTEATESDEEGSVHEEAVLGEEQADASKTAAIERSLEKYLFGNSLGFSEVQIKEVEDEESSEESSGDDSDEDANMPEDKFGGRLYGKSKRRKAAWHDEDDDEILVKDVTATYKKAPGKHGLKETSTEQYAKSLKRKFASLTGAPAWANLDRIVKEDEDSDDEFFKETTDMLETGRQTSLATGRLDFRKLKDVNSETHTEGAVIRSTEFHPRAAVGLVAGLNGTASLFRIDGKSNPKIQTVNFERFPIKTAHFTADGAEFLVGSQHHGHFFAYDLNAGKLIKVPLRKDFEQGSMQKFSVSPAGDLLAFHGRFGNIHLLSQKTRQKLFTLKMNDEVRAVAFSPDGGMLYTHGDGGEVYLWDLKAQECVHRFADDGCLRGTSMAVSPSNRFVACGSGSGVVNVYDRYELLGSPAPRPHKTIFNLTTSIESLAFNPTSEVLAMASPIKDNAIKLVHVPTMTVFNNFPGQAFNLRRVNCLDFSLNGGYLSIGNNGGAANLYRLKHYGSY